MKNAFWKGLAEGLNRNLPAILTGVSVITDVCTVGYATWSGWKIKEVTEDESLDTKTKVKKIAILSVPVVAGTALSSGCAIAAHKENSKRYTALAITAGAGALSMVNEDTKDKVLEMVDKDHKIHRSKKKDVKSNITASHNEVIEIEDEVTGYKFKTTLADLWFAVNRFNDDVSALIGTGETKSISDFYERLLGDEYEQRPAHELIKFGTALGRDMCYDKAVVLSIQLDSRLDDNLKPVYTMSYDYID